MPSHSTSSKTWVFGRVLSHLCVSICTFVLASASVFALRYYLIRGPTTPTSAPANNDRAPARRSRPAAQPPVGHHRVGSATYSHGSKIIITLQKGKKKVHEYQHHTYWHRQTSSPSLARDRYKTVNYKGDFMFEGFATETCRHTQRNMLPYR
jgi:hypothetical protein